MKTCLDILSASMDCYRLVRLSGKPVCASGRHQTVPANKQVKSPAHLSGHPVCVNGISQTAGVLGPDCLRPLPRGADSQSGAPVQNHLRHCNR